MAELDLDLDFLEERWWRLLLLLFPESDLLLGWFLFDRMCCSWDADPGWRGGVLRCGEWCASSVCTCGMMGSMDVVGGGGSGSGSVLLKGLARVA